MMRITRQLVQRAGAIFVGLWLVVFVVSMWPPCCDVPDTATTEQHHEHATASAHAHEDTHHANNAESHYCDSDVVPEYPDYAIFSSSLKKDVSGFFIINASDFDFLNRYVAPDKHPVSWLKPVFLRSVYLVTRRLRI